MSESEYIDDLKDKNPLLFEASKIIIKPTALEKLAREAFRVGQQSGNPKVDMPDFMKGLFK